MNRRQSVSEKIITRLQMSKSIRYIIASFLTLLVACILLWILVSGDTAGKMYRNSFSIVWFTQYLILTFGIASLLLSCIAAFHSLIIHKSTITFLQIVFIIFPLMILSALLVYSGFVFMLFV